MASSLQYERIFEQIFPAALNTQIVQWWQNAEQGLALIPSIFFSVVV